MSEEIKKDEIKQPEGTVIPVNDKDKKKDVEKPVTDFKIAEIWIRSGQIMIDALPSFWQDRCRALGMLMLCQEIVKTAKAPEEPKPKIIKAGSNFLNGIRNLGRKK